jgi:[acyl-carrier-protein] S-malonyltransferase
MVRIAAIFPGQGSQAVGMGKEFFDQFPTVRKLFEEADDTLGFSVRKLCFEGPEDELRKTKYTQPAILTVSYAAYCVAKESNLQFQMAGGHSLGEYTALVAADVFDFSQALQMVHKRGQLMQEAVPVGVGGMMAVVGLDRDKILEVCLKASENGIVEAVNFNCPGQTVVAGEKKALADFADLAREEGAKKVIDLPVSAPFHSSLLQPVADVFTHIIDEISFRDAAFPVTSNVHGQLLSNGNEIKECLKKQLCSSVKWEDCVSSMASQGAEYFLELGPGKVLCGFSKRIVKDIPCGNIEDATSLGKTISALEVQ